MGKTVNMIKHIACIYEIPKELVLYILLKSNHLLEEFYLQAYLPWNLSPC